MINSDLHPDSNRRPLTSLSQITVRFKGILKSASFPNSQIYADLLPSNRRPFQSADLYLRQLLPCHMIDVGQVYISALHIISNECKTSKFQT